MFKDRVVAITGGANGIGKRIASDFKEKGAKVCIVDKEEMITLWVTSRRSQFLGNLWIG